MEKKVICPYCGHTTNVTYNSSAECKGIFVRCKARHCKKIFEIKITKGNQTKGGQVEPLSR